MTLRVIGAGLPRTGTTSLKHALEQLLGESCYHMFELFENYETAGVLWWQALEGDVAARTEVLADYGAAVDWPASIFWRELHAEHPDALVVLSHRGDARTWWNSVDRTVWATMRRPPINQLVGLFNEKMRSKVGLGDDWDVPEVAMASYDELFEEVVATVPAQKLLVWQPGDGWEPLCAALGVPVPDGDFPRLNDSGEFRARAGLDTDDA